MSLDWTCKHHADLTLKELYALLQLRTEVFVVEQKCPSQEVDGLDLVGDPHHLMAWRDGRVVSSSAARGQGLGHQLMERALQAAERLWLDTPVYLSAQAHLQAYYGRYGFVAVTEVYLEDDIPHIGMRRA